jgi:hypothetical protein
MARRKLKNTDRATTPLAGSATDTALGGERLDLHNVAKFS